MSSIRKLGIDVLRLLKLYPKARAIQQKILAQSVYHRNKALSFYAQFITEGDLCFDIGAYSGSKTSIFLELGARVVCVEPQPVCAQKLQESFGNYDDVILVPEGVADKEGYAVLSICEVEPAVSTMSEKWKTEMRFSKDYEWNRALRVPVTTLDTLITKYGAPVFCKIDVEGFEKTVLRGLTQPVSFMSFEFTSELFDDIGECIDHLLSLGEVRSNCSMGETMKMSFPSWVTSTEVYEKIESQKDRLLWGDIYVKFL